MTVPRVTVLMAVHNGERDLAAAIDSILGQTFRDFELLIVNDASTDRSRAIAASYEDARVRVLDLETNVGLPTALNHGLRASRGEYVARLDADDLALPARLAKQVAFLDAHPDVVVAGSQAIAIDVRGRRLRRVPWFHPQWRRPANGDAFAWYRIFDTPFVHSSVMFRRAVVEELGGYDARHRIEEDAELWMRMAQRGSLVNLTEALVAYRFDRKSLTGDPARPERQGYVARKTRLIDGLLREGLAWDDGDRERIARLWVSVNDPSTSMTAPDLQDLATALDDCAERFFVLHPWARGDERIARHRVSMLARVIDKSIDVDRSLARSLFRAMFRLHAVAALGVSARLGALLVFGRARVGAVRRRVA